MKKNKIEKGSDEWELFQDFWKLRQRTYCPENDDDFDELIRYADALYKKFKNTEMRDFAKDLIMSHLNDVDRRCRENVIHVGDGR